MLYPSSVGIKKPSRGARVQGNRERKDEGS